MKKKERITSSNIFRLAKRGDARVLRHPLCCEPRGGWMLDTPLHVIATSNPKEALKHPKIKIIKDRYNSTPFQRALRKGTPYVLDYITSEEEINQFRYESQKIIPFLKRKFPWYDFDDPEVTKHDRHMDTVLKKLLLMNNAEKFILGG